MTTHYDIIGDIQGHATKLINLLEKLGYQKTDNVYQKSGHQAIFVGDFIDRGGEEKQVLDIVRSMMVSGHARAVMGNHEFNACLITFPSAPRLYKWKMFFAMSKPTTLLFISDSSFLPLFLLGAL